LTSPSKFLVPTKRKGDFDDNETDDENSGQNEPLSMKTDPQTAFQKWQWRKEGGLKVLKSGIRRQRYICAAKEKESCVARLTVDELADGSKEIQVSGDHCHQKNFRPRLQPQVRSKVVERGEGGGTYLQVFKSLVTNSQNLKDETITPKKKQIKNILSYENRKRLKEIYKKMTVMDRRKSDGSVAMVAFYKPFLEFLSSKNKYNMFIDGTHGLLEQGMTLTTVLYEIERIGIPVAWFLHTGKAEDDYVLLLQDLLRETKNLMQPQGIFLDFETALKNALVKTFPQIPIYGDRFHFMQANLRWLSQHKLSEYAEEVKTDLQNMWKADSLAGFCVLLKKFETTWKVKAYPYWSYFEAQWVKQIKPAFWARYGRGASMPTGDNILERWHGRVKEICNRRHQSPIYLLSWLVEEGEYFHRVLNTPHLLADLHREMETTKTYESNRKSALAPPVQIEEVQTNEISTEESRALALVTFPESQELRDLENSAIFEPNEPNKPLSSTGSCLSCNKNKSNKGCTFNLCSACCSRDPRMCSYTNHRYAKIDHHPRLKEIQNQIGEAMKNERILWVRYRKGSRPNTVRAIIPTQWEDSRHSKFKVRSMDPLQKDQEEHTYFVDRISQASWNSFE